MSNIPTMTSLAHHLCRNGDMLALYQTCVPVSWRNDHAMRYVRGCRSTSDSRMLIVYEVIASNANGVYQSRYYGTMTEAHQAWRTAIAAMAWYGITARTIGAAHE